MTRRAAIVLAVALGACEGGAGPRMWFAVTTPHEEYAAQLARAGLDGAALGRDWLAAAERALVQPVEVDVPHLEARYLDPARATAVAYAFPLERGQRLVVTLDVAGAGPADIRLFLDLFYQPDTAAPPLRVVSAEGAGWSLEYVALRPGRYLLRAQPELLRGGRATVTLRVRASLDFPVAGVDLAAIRSGFGAPRDGGRRDHHGVDIFAPRGTPVVAAAAGRVSRIRTGGLGGNVVWLREAAWGRSLYYAHLDTFAVVQGAEVRPGDTLGFVGNTGNARTTPPHLHFGIYLRGVGPVDPRTHLFDPPDEPPTFAGDTLLVGRWVRVARPGAALRARPRADAPAVAEPEPLTPLELLAGTGRWYRARLPDGREGYLAQRDAQPLEPIATAAIVAATMVRTAPALLGGEMETLAAGAQVPVLGRSGDEVLVRHPHGFQGWIPGGVLSGDR